MGWIYLSFKNMVEDDAKNFIVANFENGTYNADTDWEEVCDDMFDSDEVCGNASFAGHPDCFLVTYEPDSKKIANMFVDEEIRELLEDDYGMEVPWYKFAGHGQDGITKLDAWIRTAMLGQLNDDLYKYFEQVQKDLVRRTSMGTLGVGIGVEKCSNFDGPFYKSNIVINSEVKTAEYAKAAHQLASLNAKFLAKFNYATDYAGNIMDMELDDDLLEFLYPALIEGYEKLTKKKQKHEEEISRKFNQNSVNMIKRVKYDNPWTIVWWRDGKVTRSKCAENDVWSESAGFNACVAKHYFQTAGAYNKVLKTYCTDVHNDKVTNWQDGYDTGYADSREDGYCEGREDGYDEGFEDGQNYERQERKEMNFED